MKWCQIVIAYCYVLTTVFISGKGTTPTTFDFFETLWDSQYHPLHWEKISCVNPIDSVTISGCSVASSIFIFVVVLAAAMTDRHTHTHTHTLIKKETPCMIFLIIILCYTFYCRKNIRFFTPFSMHICILQTPTHTHTHAYVDVVFR